MKRYLIAGLLIWVPLGVTIMVVRMLVNLMDKTLLLLPKAYQPDQLFGVYIPGLGVVLSVVVVLLTGMIVANLFGRKLVSLWEAFLARIPLIRSIYSSVKQIVETVFSSKGQSFRKVVLVEYPRRDMWTLAFLSGDGRGEAQTKAAGKNVEVVNVFVPTTPNPTSGFFIILPRSDIIELDMSVDDGLKMIISAGMVVPVWDPDNPKPMLKKKSV